MKKVPAGDTDTASCIAGIMLWGVEDYVSLATGRDTNWVCLALCMLIFCIIWISSSRFKFSFLEVFLSVRYNMYVYSPLSICGYL